MRPTKFFRKYNRTLILVFMSLLLVAFLLTDVISSWGRSRGPSDAEVGKAFGETITTADLGRVGNQAQIAAQFGIVGPSRDPVDSYLMLEETRRMGIHVGEQDVKAALASSGFTGERLAAVAKRHGLSTKALYEILGGWMAVSQVQGLLLGAVEPSRPRLEYAFRQQSQEAVVKLSVLESRAFLTAVTEPTEEEIAAYFEEAKDRETSHTADELVYGYRRPDRVQIEYITLDPEAIRKSVSVRAAEALGYYERNRSKYVRPAPRPADGAQPGRPIQLSYEEVKERVREDCRGDKAVQEAHSILTRVRAELAEPWDTAARGEDGYQTAPAGDHSGAFQALVDKHANTYPLVYKKTDVLDETGLRREPGFFQAGYQESDTVRITAPQLALRVKGLHQIAKSDTSPAFNLFEPSPVISSTRTDPRTRERTIQQSYFFRVIRVVPAGPPDSLDEVREELVEDLKMLKAHEMAAVHARSLRDRAAQVGLDEAVAAAEALRSLLTNAETLEAATGEPGAAPGQYLRDLGPFTPKGFIRSQPFVRYEGGFLISGELPEQVFALGDEPPTDPHRAALVQLTNSQKWVVAELVELKPLYEGDFEDRRDQLVQGEARVEQRTFLVGWFDPEQLRLRTGYEPDESAQQVEQ